MPKSKKQKASDLSELVNHFKTASSAVFTDYRGTSVKDITKFRQVLRQGKIFSKVYKLTLVRRAMKAAGIAGEIGDYKAPVILSLSGGDETAPARQIKNLAEEIRTLKILEGVIDGRVAAKDMVMALANLPGKDQLRAQVAGAIKAPLSGFMNVMAGNLRGLVIVLQGLASK